MRDCIGLKVGRAYTYYQDNGTRPVAFAVSAACRDRLEPYKWSYPVIGVYEAKGFFDRARAERQAEQLRSKGYDAAVGNVSGFSTIGVLPDPIRASNLRGDDFDLASLVFHELTHNTIFKRGDTRFNESMATFVGRAAAARYFDRTFGEGSPEAAAAKRKWADLEVIDSYVSDLCERLESLYAEPIPCGGKSRTAPSRLRRVSPALGGHLYTPIERAGPICVDRPGVHGQCNGPGGISLSQPGRSRPARDPVQRTSRRLSSR